RRLQRKILIKGNHEDMLAQILKQGRITGTHVSNGTDYTVAELFGEASIDAYGDFDRGAYAEKLGELRDFLDSMLNYYETERYVFTHGWLPIVIEGEYPRFRPVINPQWRNVPDSEWEEETRLLEWQQLYPAKAMLDGKTIVCGHRASFLAHVFDPSREHDDSTPFYGDGMIAIDAHTVRSGRVNVIVIDEP
ncbi:MAG: hypothetical protein IKD07_02285, partial [Clostridia bacterium]|nr:hypothetical protein [Clostridia bacterium]